MKIWIAEAMGTFGLVFCGSGAVLIDNISGGAVTHVGVGLTFGLVIMAMIYAVGETSGAHINPAVTLGFVLAGRLRPGLLAVYWTAQVAGALAASALLLALFGNHASLGATLPSGSAMQSFGLETVLTFILVFVILRVATGSKETGMMAGIAIGGVIGLEALFAGPISGASMNPARSLAPALVSGNLHSLWVYLAGPFLGAALAAPVWAALAAKRPPAN